MSSPVAYEIDTSEHLSALVDGELNDQETAAACARWRGHAETRACWHAYQLMGDVLRSEDLANDPARDAAFLQAVSARLAQEPVVAASWRSAVMQRSPQAPHGSWRWKATSAIAAGFVVVAVGFVFIHLSNPTAPGATAVAQAPTERAFQSASADPAAVGMQAHTTGLNGLLIRDAQLDGYLAAHKQFAGTSALGVPSVFLRSATLEVPAR